MGLVGSLQYRWAFIGQDKFWVDPERESPTDYTLKFSQEFHQTLGHSSFILFCEENLWFLQKAFFMGKTPLNAEKFLKKIGLGKEDHYFWKQIGKALLCTYTLFGVAWWWNETSPLGWMTLKPKPKEEKEMAYLYERRRFPYPGDKEATDEFIASGGTIGTTIGPKGIIESGEDPDNFQKKLRSKKLEQESLKLWLRMRNEVISDLQEKGYDVE